MEVVELTGTLARSVRPRNNYLYYGNPFANMQILHIINPTAVCVHFFLRNLLNHTVPNMCVCFLFVFMHFTRNLLFSSQISTQHKHFFAHNFQAFYTQLLFFNCSEIIRVIDSLQLTAYKKVATPANWNVSPYKQNCWLSKINTPSSASSK